MEISNNMNYNEIIKNIIQSYYNDNKKKRIFNKGIQKNEIAEIIEKNIDLTKHIRNEIYINQTDDKHIFASYPNIKDTMCKSTYDTISSVLDDIILTVVNKHQLFFLHIDIFSISVSSINRFKMLIDLFMNKNNLYIEKDRIDYLQKCYIYNAPPSMQNISSLLKPLIDARFIQKIVYVQK